MKDKLEHVIVQYAKVFQDGIHLLFQMPRKVVIRICGDFKVKSGGQRFSKIDLPQV